MNNYESEREALVRRYLFIGGPWDGTWIPTNGHNAWLVPGRGRMDRFGVSIGRTLYYRRSVWVRGWLFPIDLYVLDATPEIDRDVVLPGYAHGQMEASPILSWAWSPLAPRALRRAVAAFNRERLAR